MYELRDPTFEEGLGNNIPEPSNNYETANRNSSNGLLVLLSVTTLIGVVSTFYAIKHQNKKFENSFRQRLISTSKEHKKEIKQES